MAVNQVLGGEGGGTQTTRRRTRRRTRARANGGIATSRAGAATGIGGTEAFGGGNRTVNLAGLTPDQRKFYDLGARHACEMHNIPWQGAKTGR